VVPGSGSGCRGLIPLPRRRFTATESCFPRLFGTKQVFINRGHGPQTSGGDGRAYHTPGQKWIRGSGRGGFARSPEQATAFEYVCLGSQQEKSGGQNPYGGGASVIFPGPGACLGDRHRSGATCVCLCPKGRPAQKRVTCAVGRGAGRRAETGGAKALRRPRVGRPSAGGLKKRFISGGDVAVTKNGRAENPWSNRKLSRRASGPGPGSRGQQMGRPHRREIKRTLARWNEAGISEPDIGPGGCSTPQIVLGPTAP